MVEDRAEPKKHVPPYVAYHAQLDYYYHFRLIILVDKRSHSGQSGFVKQGGGSPDETRLEQTPYTFKPH